MSLLPYGSSRHANLATKFGPAQGKIDSLMPYGSLDNAGIVSKVQADPGKKSRRVRRIGAESR